MTTTTIDKSFSRRIFVDPSGKLAAVFMAVFAGLAAWRWTDTGNLFFALLFFRDAVLSYFFCVRKPSKTKGTQGQAAIAYISTAWPLLYQVSNSTPVLWVSATANFLFIAGFLIATLAVIELGTRMGVSPAKRGKLCKTGVYKWFRHPMYYGYIVAESGWILLNPVNLALFGVALLGYIVRMKMENALFREKQTRE